MREEIIAAFGPESYLPDGRLNRAHLAQQVFGDDEKVARINSIVHPRVFEAFQEQARQSQERNTPLLVHEAALTFETGSHKLMFDVLLVWAPTEQRIQRVMERDGVTREQVISRMKHQIDPDEARKRADFVIENDDDLDTLARKNEAIYARNTQQGHR